MKYKVDFLLTMDSGEQKIIETAVYDDELDIIIVSNEKFFDGILYKREFIIGSNEKLYSIKNDKMKFMENLKYAFSGSMLRATEIQKII